MSVPAIMIDHPSSHLERERSSGPQLTAPLSRTEHPRKRGLHHVLVLHVVDRKKIHRNQNGGGAASVLPPVRRAFPLSCDVAGLVHDRHGAIARILDHLTGVAV